MRGDQSLKSHGQVEGEGWSGKMSLPWEGPQESQEVGVNGLIVTSELSSGWTCLHRTRRWPAGLKENWLKVKLHDFKGSPGG